MNSHDHVIKKVPLATKTGGVRNYKRQMHLNCVPKYNERLENVELKQKENSDWDEVYQYFRKEILDMSVTVPLPEHATKRLLGLRLGQYYPSGNNTRLLPRGYDFKTILVALKVTRPKLVGYLSTTEFANTKHRIDGIFKFIVAEIPDVAKRIETQKKANAKLDEEVIKTPTFDYQEALKKKKAEEKKQQESNGIADDISSLLGGSL
ncbi:hypothetical protein [Viridibacillus arvi]|uniref:hypothetical protein n=1 Tax=Viridibacillus arvi TaxID=263475 RepID=UPI0034CDA359